MQGIKMLKLLPLFILLMLITGGAAMSSEKSTDILNTFNGSGYHAIILTDNDEHLNGQYYYALLMMRDRHPGQSYDVHIYNKKDRPSLTDQFKVKSYPALVLIKDHQAVSMIAGPNNWSKIYKKLNKLPDITS